MMVVLSIPCTLEQRPGLLNCVCVLITINILLLVVDNVVLQLTSECIIGVVFVRHKFGFFEIYNQYSVTLDMMDNSCS